MVRVPRRARNAPKALPSTRSPGRASRVIQAPRRTVLPVGGLVQYPGARRQRAVRDRQPIGCAARAGRRADRRVARPQSDGLFRQEAGRPHRRPEDRLEGPRIMGDLGQSHAVPHRGDRRTGAGCPGCHTRDAVKPARRRIPAPPRPAGSLRRPGKHAAPLTTPTPAEDTR